MAKKRGTGASAAQLPKTRQTQIRQFKVDFGPLLQQSNLSAAKPLIESIERDRNAKLICLVYNNLPPVPSMLTPPAILPLEEVLSSLGKVPNLDLFLRCTGGIAEVPWRVVSLLREFVTERLGVIVSRIALSGATHIAIAADELIMTPFSILGSVDPTRRHPLLPKDSEGKPIPTSVEDLKHCIKFIREQLEESYPEQDLALIISELFKYINPLAIGALEQSYNLSKLISEKCLKTRKKALNENHINKIVDQLAGGYFSHSFQISRSEVESDLELPVIRPNDKLSQLILDLENHFMQLFNKTAPIQPPDEEPLFRIGGVIQGSDVCWTIASLFQKNGQLVTDPWVKFNQEVKSS